MFRVEIGIPSSKLTDTIRQNQSISRKAEELTKAEATAKLREQRRLEEKAKALEALERKKRIAEKAQMRAELRAQKEAELSEQVRNFAVQFMCLRKCALLHLHLTQCRPFALPRKERSGCG